MSNKLSPQKRHSSEDQPFVDAEDNFVIEITSPSGLHIPLKSIQPLPMSIRPDFKHISAEDAMEISSQWDQLEDARRAYDAVLLEQSKMDKSKQALITPMQERVDTARGIRDKLDKEIRAFYNAAKKRYKEEEAEERNRVITNPLSTTTTASGSGAVLNPQTIMQPREMKVKEPSSFNGDRKDYDRWLFEVKNILNVKPSINTDIKRITYAGTLLSGMAFTWYQVWITTHTQQGVMLGTWNDFLQSLDTTFKDPNEVSNYRRQVIEAKQGSMDFSAYAIHFLNLCQKANYNPDDHLETFKRSLTRQSLLSWHPTLIPTTYIETVNSIRTGIEVYKDIQSSLPPRHDPAPSPSRQSAKSSTPNQSSSSRNPGSSSTSQQVYDTSKPGVFTSSPTTPTYRVREKKGLCTRCGMDNHKSDKCYIYPTSKSNTENYEKSVKLHGHRFNSVTGQGYSTPTQTSSGKTHQRHESPQKGQALPSRMQPSTGHGTQFNNIDSDDEDELSEAETDVNTTDSAYSSRRSLSRKRLSRRLANQERVHLYLTEFAIKEKNQPEVQGLALVDSGANRTMIGRSFISKHKVKTMYLPEPITMTLGDGETKLSITRQTRRVRFRVGDMEEEIKLPILETNDFDLILGLDWLTRENPLIDWKERIMQRKDANRSMSTNRTQVDSMNLHETTPAVTDKELMSIPPSTWPMSEFPHIFDMEKQSYLPEFKPGWDFDVVFKDEKKMPITRPLFKLPKAQRDLVDVYVDEELKNGKIRVTNSSIASNLFFVPKNDSTTELRPCIDYRGLNECTKDDKYPLPPLSTLVQDLVGGTWYAKLDWRWAYNNIRIKKGQEWKFAFKCHRGLYEPLVMPFGPKQAPGHMQRYVTEHVKDFIEEGWLFNILDDFVIKTVGSVEDHKEHIRRYLQRIQDLGIFIKESKCLFFEKEIPFVGFMVNQFGYWKQPSKIAAIQEWAVPNSVKDVRSFMGFVNFYRPFVERLSLVAKPLFDLTVKGSKFKWEDQHQKSFDTIKSIISKDVILMFPKPNQPFILHFDSSDIGTGAVLQQYDEKGLLRPIEFFSKKWNKAEFNYSTPDKELFGLVLALQHWYSILFGVESIMVYTDHKSLRDFSKTQLLRPRHARWALILEDFKDRMKINWIAGKKNVIADVVSRNPSFALSEKELKERLETTVLPESVFMAPFTVLNDIEEEDSDEEDELEVGRPTSRTCQPHQIDITNDREKQIDVLHIHHDNILAGHFGFKKTLDLIQRRYWWKGMSKDVKQYVDSCDVCQKSKSSRQAPSGKLIPLPIPDRNWQNITMDFIVKLPKSKKFDSILVVVDRRSKMAHFIPCNETITAEGTAKLVFNHIVCQHGMPQSIVSDRGPQFKSHFWKELWKLLGSKVNLSTAYHPQTDGQSERVNQTLEQYIRCFTSYNQDDWSELLPMAELAYNNSYNESIGMSPYYAVTGQDAELEHLGDAIDRTTNPPEAGRIKAHFDAIYSQLQHHLEKAQKRYKESADQHRKQEEVYHVNDQVLLSTKNIRTERPTKKLDYTWIGPYRIKRQINPVTYELDLPENMKIHNVFHSQLLKRYVEGDIIDRRVVIPPPIRNVEEGPGYIIEAILDVRRKGKGFQYLIKWLGYGNEDNTWEPRSHLNDDEMLQLWHEAHPNKPSPFNLFTTLRNKGRNNDTTVSVVSPLVDTSSSKKSPSDYKESGNKTSLYKRAVGSVQPVTILNRRMHKDASAHKVMRKEPRVNVKVKPILKHLSQFDSRRPSHLNRSIKVRFSELVNSSF